MATTTSNPTANSTPANWTTTGGSVPTILTDASDGSYISSPATSGSQHQLVMADISLTPPQRIRIDSVTLNHRTQRGGASNVNYLVTTVVGANTTDGSAQTATSTATNYTDTFTTKPAGGRWTQADVNSMEYRIRPTQSRVCRLIEASATVTYVTTVHRNSLSTCGGGR